MKNIILSLTLLALFQCRSSENTTSVANLENTYWKLAEMNGMPVITPENSKEVHFVLSSEGSEKRIKGFAGCNGLGGNYTLNGDKIKFTTMTTKIACDRLDVENFLTKAMESADSYKIKGEKLELYEGNTLLATFESVYLK